MRNSIKVPRPRGFLSLADTMALLLWCLCALWATQAMLAAAAQIVGGFPAGIG